MSNDNNRFVALEEEIAHLRIQNEELSSQIHEQWKELERLRKQLAFVEERFSRIEDDLDIPQPDEKPPHW